MAIRSFTLACAGAAVISLTMGFPNEGHSFGLGDIKAKSGLLGGGSSSTVDVAGLSSQQQELMGQFSSAMENMLLAQSKTLEATGYKEEALAASEAALNYQSGNINDPNAVERDKELTIKNQEIIENAVSQQTTLTEEGRAALLEALPYYGKGMYDGYQLPDAFQAWSGNAKNGLDSLKTQPGEAAKLGGKIKEVTTVTTNLPGLVKAWGSTTKTFLTYAKSNDVDVSDVESKLGDL